METRQSDGREDTRALIPFRRPQSFSFKFRIRTFRVPFDRSRSLTMIAELSSPNITIKVRESPTDCGSIYRSFYMYQIPSARCSIICSVGVGSLRSLILYINVLISIRLFL